MVNKPPNRTRGDFGVASVDKPPHCTRGGDGDDTTTKINKTADKTVSTGGVAKKHVANGGRSGIRSHHKVTPHSERFISSKIGQTNDFWIKLHNEVSSHTGPNAFGAKVKIPTPINIDYLEKNLSNYRDIQVLEFFKYGWPVGAVGDIRMDQSKWPRNHDSATKHSADIDDFIAKGFANDSLIGPFDVNPFNCPIGISPLASKEKSDSPDRRVFLDMSSPHDESVNDLISRNEFLGEKFKLIYPKVDQLVSQIKLKGRGCAMFKRDLKAAYRQLLRVDPKDIPLLGFVWRGKLYFDLTQPQGSRSAAMQCQRSTSAIKEIYVRKHQEFDLVNYLDDFGAAEHWHLVEEGFSWLGEVLENAGLQESAHKQCRPSTDMIFLGVGLDSEARILYVTEDRLVETKDRLNCWYDRQDATKKEVQSIAGVLSFIAICVPSSRIFMGRIFGLMKVLPKFGKHDLTRAFKLDIQWWIRFMELYNGVSMMLVEEWSEPDAIMATDACLIGCGGWFAASRLFFHTEFPSSIKARFNTKHHITQLEMLTVLLACKVWGHLLAGCRVLIYCDNEGTVNAINYHRAVDNFLQLCARELNLVCAQCHCQVRAEHIAGVDNRIPDFLSRWSLDSSYKNRFYNEIGPYPAWEHQVEHDMFSFAENW